MGVVHSASSLVATNTNNTDICSIKGVPSTSGASTMTTSMTTDSKTCICSKKTTHYGEKYEIIPLDTGIISKSAMLLSQDTSSSGGRY